MAYDYDALYRETPDALGAPTPSVVAIFDTYLNRPSRVLDIGCGQGRDAVFLARRGHSVIGIDLSPHGIKAMNQVAAREGLSIVGVVADVAEYPVEGEFDLLLIDRTLHMLDRGVRLGLLGRLLKHVTFGGAVLIADEPSNMAEFAEIFAQSDRAWQITKAKPGLMLALSDGVVGPAGLEPATKAL